MGKREKRRGRGTVHQREEGEEVTVSGKKAEQKEGGLKTAVRTTFSLWLKGRLSRPILSLSQGKLC